MKDYTSDDYFYFNNNEERTQSNIKVCILNQESDCYISSPLKLLAENMYNHCQNYFQKMFELWINHSIKVIAQLSNIYV